MICKTRLPFSFLLLLLPAASGAAAQVPELAAAGGAAAPITMRLMFGMDKLTPERWDGSIAVTPGRVLSLGGVHFEGRDRIVAPNAWLLTNRVTRYADSTMPRGYDPVHTRPFAMIPNGVVAALDAPEDAAVAIETVMGSFSFTPAEIPFGRSKSFLDGAALVERTVPTVDFTSGESYNDYAALAAAGDGSVWLSWIGYKNEKDAVWLARHSADGWGKPIRVSPQGEYTDNFRAAVAEAADGRIVVVWSGKSPSGEWGIFSRILDGGALSGVAVVGGASQNLYHRVTADGKGSVHVVWQGFRDRVSKILHARWDGSAWSGETVVSGPEGDNWAPDIAADSKGNVWVGWDGYAAGDFNVYVRRLNAGGSWDGIRQITASPAFEANAALACDANDRLWIAWDHGEANWGKDWSSQRFKPGGGAGLYRTRAVKVAVLDGKRLKQPPALMDAIPAEAKDYVQQARLQTDADGNLWAMVRSLTSTTTRVNNNWGAGGIWEMLLTRLDPSGWTPAVKLHATNGRNDVWASSALSAGGKLWFAWSRDARPFGSPARAGNRPTPAAQTTHIAYTTLDPSATAWRSAGQPRLAPFREAAARAAPVHANEAADTAAIRSYRYEAGGKSYRILRGDLHRHTDISSDGIGEGGLIDFYRYAITAGSYDFMMVADHQFGGDTVPGVEYNWWRTEKSEDIFLVPGRFWPLFGTERSLPYPNGHRNTVFARRGIRRLPIQAGERNAVINTGDVLYPYLRRNGGITTGHTSGTDQGTDWRDSDPEVEPIVEIYQGLHASYEYPGAPRAETPDKRYYHHGEAWRPDGFVWEAWAKGIKIGVQASSDHVGTHDAYACVLVPADKQTTRQDLLDGMRARRTYAATDNIIVDVRIGDHLMGEAFASSEPPVVKVRAVGTLPIARVVLIKNNEFVYTAEPGTKDIVFEFRDDAPAEGESYYYARVEQSDGSLAWSSPIWVDYR